MNKHIEFLISRYPVLAECAADIEKSFELLKNCYSNGNKLLIAGNGGSCADSAHIVGELMKGFKLPRRCPEDFSRRLEEVGGEQGAYIAQRLQGALPAINLCEHAALNTAYMNDMEGGGLLTFAQQVYGYGKKGDVFWGITTSGNSKNIISAAIVAKAAALKVIALTGAGGGKISGIADVTIAVPVKETYMVQELHLPVYHCLCLMLEEHFFN